MTVREELIKIKGGKEVNNEAALYPPWSCNIGLQKSE